jgi:hypothetical protein
MGTLSLRKIPGRDNKSVSKKLKRCGMADELRVKFWGVRGSYPTPGPGTVRYGSNTACVEIRLGERMVVLELSLTSRLANKSTGRL